ncbi:protein translocase subunit SecD [Demequina sp. SYSU T00068]|uniref:protein translocase subunit SecD n=1 Tax=Demequina lignilytica TaxID=3051663 RepID=UPI002639D05E|nr:protein translocase subunit SecD [Demequina sp. SYSU T00068]MDN4489418.1 protein translocase subunit SecD [Demequina sp. SYSU T00068]
MARVKNGARRALVWLGAIVVGLYGLLAVGVLTGGASWTPSLALDLAGGRQIILTPTLAEGSDQEIDQADLEQAVEIIRRRIDASGVAEAEISTQGNNIVVALPGNPDAATVDLVRQSAQLEFRPVLVVGSPLPVTEASATPEPSASASADASATPEPSASATDDAAASSDAEATAEPTASATAEAAASSSASASPEATATDDATTSDTVSASDLSWVTDEVQAEYDALDCTAEENLSGVAPQDPDAAAVVCDQTGVAKYILGPQEMSGTDVATATSGPELSSQGTLTGRYEVRLELTDDGGSIFADITGRIKDLESPRNQFAMVLDGVVISAPSVSTTITGGQASITGSFTQESAQQLANQLKFGALPLTLTVQSEEQISATLGADQLEKGLIAGAIGLVLVVIYSLIQYRALGLVTVGSLAIAGTITYALIALLSWTIGYRLSLAGVAGLIVAIGVTADSFIVYFERVRDELREGRSLQAAIDHGWRRARRTILASDAINILAAVVLYVLAVGGVRGFAFTLGLTTLVDILVVFMFTHPILMLLAKTSFFGGGHQWSGLDPRQLGRDTVYKGRGKVVLGSKPTLAERKAAERAAAKEADAQETTPASTEGEENR